MKVSIIIPVKEINDYVRESLLHISALDYGDFEAIVLPDGNGGMDLPGATIVPTGPMGPAAKRDFALRRAEGEILAFLDDDAFPEKDWLKNAVRHFMDPEVAAVGGPAVTPENDSWLQRASGAVFSSYLASSGYVYRYVPCEKKEVDDFPTVNLFVRRSVFKSLGGFSTEYWPGEDTKLCLDITKRLGMKIIYDPEVLVRHHRRPLFMPHLKQVARYAFQRGYFVRAFPATSLRLGYFVPSIFLFFLTGGLLASFVSKTAFIAYMGLLSVYAASLLAASLITAVSTGDIPVGLVMAPGIFFTHVTYGFNFLQGLLRGKAFYKGVADANLTRSDESLLKGS